MRYGRRGVSYARECEAWQEVCELWQWDVRYSRLVGYIRQDRHACCPCIFANFSRRAAPSAIFSLVLYQGFVKSVLCGATY